jgi:hypothetical protein
VSGSLIDLGAQVTQLLDVRQQSAADLFLIRARKIGNFTERYVECPYHHGGVSHCQATVHTVPRRHWTGKCWRAGQNKTANTYVIEIPL